MCETHLGDHIRLFGKHEYEHLNIDFEESMLQELRSDILKRINDINKAKKLIQSKTTSLIKTIEEVLIVGISRLNGLKEKLLEIIVHSKFCQSELLEIKKFQATEFNLELIDIEKILVKTKKVFGVEFDNYMQKKLVRKK